MAFFPTIEKVTLGALSNADFEVANKFSFSTGILVSICKDKVFVKKGDLFKLPESSEEELEECKQNDPCTLLPKLANGLKVLDCEPFHKGVISITTKFVIVDISNNQKNQQTDYENGTPSSGAIHLSEFVTPLTFDTLSTCLSHTRSSDWTSQLHVSFKVDALVTNNICSISNKDITSDPNYTIFVPKFIAKQHKLYHECLVEIIKHNSKSLPQQKCKVQIQHKHKRRKDKSVVATICIVKNDTVQISPNIAFNVSRYDEMSSCKELFLHKFKGVSEEEISSSCSPSWFCSIPYAQEVHVATIHSPNYSSGADFTTLLKAYFTSTRHVKKGDVLTIHTKDVADFWQDVTDNVLDMKPVIFFKILKVLPKLNGVATYKADKVHSSLFLNGACHAFAPTVTSSWLTGADLYPPGLQPLVTKLVEWIKPFMARHTHISAPCLLLTGAPGCGKASVVHSAAMVLNFHYLQINCHELCGDTSATTEVRIKHMLARAVAVAPCLLNMHNIEALAKDRDGSDDSRVAVAFNRQLSQLVDDNPDWPVIVIATTSYPKQLGPEMHDGFLHELKMEVPSESSRLTMLHHLVKGLDLSTDVDLKFIAQRTAGMVLGDLGALVDKTKRRAVNDILKQHSDSLPSWREQQVMVDAGFSLMQQHFIEAVEELHTSLADAMGAPKIPSVQWEDVGGLASVKAHILDTIQLPLEHPQLLAAGLRRSGVLLYGAPGTGKTLLAKAVATECSLNFLSVKGPELINMYVGQSEENVRNVFERARNASPCVIFFDELDSLAPNRGRSGDSGGVMDRVVSQLLAELDGLHRSCDIFVIGATNRPDLLDPALLRPGRFDKLLYLGVSEDKAAQLNIVKALTRKFTLSDDCDLQQVVGRCPPNLTGADFYALCSDAMLSATKRKIELLEAGHDVDQSRLVVSFDDFLNAVDHLVPSVSAAELHKYALLERMFSKQATSAVPAAVRQS